MSIKQYSYVLPLLFTALILNNVVLNEWPYWWLIVDAIVWCVWALWFNWQAIVFTMKNAETQLFGRPLDKDWWKDGKKPKFGVKQ